ncbi:glycoside hydrolase [Aspergillus steynii IBT 23096]|uniref:beta-N-acetylhexosaminidase n=1 Tax=Aspergillus steynii IBT 23096 TaxID=1392250 RepID=A0A2I2FSB2_9EURO|nr:glycoside hydrolase [Aspergillus steynii IBT 23096]PLB43525.1 glycoside hydrolase [Aspergillus steynii IBT 23096]
MHWNRSWGSALLLALSARVSPISGHTRLVTVPTMPFVETNDTYSLDQLTGIVVDVAYANTVDHAGQTLIPPTLHQFAETFQEDLESSIGLSLPLNLGVHPLPNSIFLTLTNHTGFHDAAGRPTAEAYSLNIHSNGIEIAGASPLGAWWGTRSLIQAAVVTGEKLPHGSGLDTPGWANRGIMLDAGRHYYPPEFLIEMCSYLSFFKQNVFHVHLSDNLYNNVDLYSREESMDLYAAFRLWSDDSAVAGLNKRANESYSYDQFNRVQQQCAQRGVTIIPEIEAPGHALVIGQWQPELALDDLSMLNISHPDTIPTMEAIWETFLPWFHSKTVHIGADEYEKDLVADYTKFVNQLNSYITEESGKDIRIWGTFTPKEGANVSTEVSIQHWAYFEDNAYSDFIQNGYDVLNSDDAFYIVAKWSGSYPQQLNKTRIFHGNPAGGAFAPNIFDVKDASRNPARDNDRVLGHVAALWNDYGSNATTVLETYYSWRDRLPALGDKQWGGDLLEDEYDSVFEKLHAAIPAQNLDRQVRSKTDTILQYTFDEDSQIIPDESGNGYDGIVHGCDIQSSSLVLSDGCYLETPLGSKGRDYTLSFSVKPTSDAPGNLFAGPDSILTNGNGSITNVTFISGGNAYSLNYSLPLNTWTDVRVVGKGAHTMFVVESDSMEFFTRLGLDGQGHLWAPIAIEAPLKRIGEGFTGMIKDIVLQRETE